MKLDNPKSYLHFKAGKSGTVGSQTTISPSNGKFLFFILISAQVRAWLDNMSSDLDTNKTGRKWGDFTDFELQDHILR